MSPEQHPNFRHPVLDTGAWLFFGSGHNPAMAKGGWVYIMANRCRGGMYVGVTSDLIRRVQQHREGDGSIHVTGFNKTRVVYCERHDDIELAIAREKLVKKWRREWKFALIEADNPDWSDLWTEWFPADDGSSPAQR